jgi:chromosome segregation ATPase
MPKHSSPFITSAGRDHVILSKQFAIVASVMLLCAGIIFIRVEQGAVKRSVRNADHVKDQNMALGKKNEDLVSIKKQLQQDEEELTNMYEKWLADDGEKLRLTKANVLSMRQQIESVRLNQDTKEDILGDKEAALGEKEAVLSELHVQLRAKNDMMKSMKQRIKNLNGTLPALLAEQPDDDDWAW